jgi:hypothetical protein
MGSFQLLGYTLSTATGYFRANYIHHFEGFITDKLPVIRWLRLSLAAGGGVLLLQQDNFRHAEIFAGIERQFRIKTQLFRIGCYAVTADNKLQGAHFNWKFGISFYDKYSGRWQ